MVENMLENYSLILLILFYIIGSIPFAVVISKIFSLPDPRSFGSNNPGATNVMRSGNKIAGFLTFLFDLIKGFLPIFILNINGAVNSMLCLLALAIIIGHIFSMFLKFRGGKGVATSFGTLLGINFMMGISAVIVWLIVFMISKVSGLSAIVSFLLLPFIVYIMKLDDFVLIFSFVNTFIILFSHKKNIIDFMLKKI
jgi:glycerol-3-phosphate acyltransferase PlsY